MLNLPTISKNSSWTDVELNNDIVSIPESWKAVRVGDATVCLDSRRKPLNKAERSKMKGTIPYWGANSVVDHVNDFLIDEEVVLLGEDAAPFFDKDKPVAFHLNTKIWPNNHIHVLKAVSVAPAFLTYALNRVEYLKIIGTEARPKLTQSMMNGIQFAMPGSLAEQTRIAAVLSKQEQVVADLKTLVSKLEQRQSYFSRELLSGRLRVEEGGGELRLFHNTEWVDTQMNGAMRPLPRDWHPAQIGEDIAFSIGNTPPKQGDNYNGTLPWVTISDIAGRVLSKHTSKVCANGRVKPLPAGSLLGSFKLSVGRFCFTEEVVATNEAILAIQPDGAPKHELGYLYYVLPEVFVDNATQNAHGALLLNTTTIKGLSFAAPQKPEQALIARFLDSLGAQIQLHRDLQRLESQKFFWLLDNLMTGRYLLTE